MYFYTIDKEYLTKCKAIDKKVLMKGDRPYIGVVLKVGNYDYFAPLASSKQVKEKLNHQSTVKIFGEENDFLGAVRLNNMIPCNKDLVTLIDIPNVVDEKYRKLLYKQYERVNYIYKEKIETKAQRIYRRKLTLPNDYVSRLCCDFTKLEELLKEY